MRVISNRVLLVHQCGRCHLIRWITRIDKSQSKCHNVRELIDRFVYSSSNCNCVLTRWVRLSQVVVLICAEGELSVCSLVVICAIEDKIGTADFRRCSIDSDNLCALVYDLAAFWLNCERIQCEYDVIIGIPVVIRVGLSSFRERRRVPAWIVKGNISFCVAYRDRWIVNLGVLSELSLQRVG